MCFISSLLSKLNNDILPGKIPKIFGINPVPFSVIPIWEISLNRKPHQSGQASLIVHPHTSLTTTTPQLRHARRGIIRAPANVKKIQRITKITLLSRLQSRSPMLHCTKHCSPIPTFPQWQQSVNDLDHSNVLTRTRHGHEFWTSFNISMVVRHLLASRHPEPNAFGAKVLVPMSLLIDAWRILLADYHDNVVAEFLAFGWPINYTRPSLPSSTSHNHPSATQYDSHVREYINTSIQNCIGMPWPDHLTILLFRSPPSVLPYKPFLSEGQHSVKLLWI